jgi:hypothetical protein
MTRPSDRSPREAGTPNRKGRSTRNVSRLSGVPRGRTGGRPSPWESSLFLAPLELMGDWGSSPPEAAFRVLSRVREACLTSVALLSDRQPKRIRVESRSGGFPAIWLHDDDASMAWILVTIGACDWCQLAYQFGHELGHVLCNSWDKLAYPRAPCQWLEESLVEAFTIRGLGILAEAWERDPPFEGDCGFSDAIRRYRNNLIARYEAQSSHSSCSVWFRAARRSLEQRGGESEAEGPATLCALAELEESNRSIEDLGALNRWPLRSGIAIEDYLKQWQTSCAEIRTPGRLPKRLRRLLDLNP